MVRCLGCLAMVYTLYIVSFHLQSIPGMHEAEPRFPVSNNIRNFPISTTFKSIPNFEAQQIVQQVVNQQAKPQKAFSRFLKTSRQMMNSFNTQSLPKEGYYPHTKHSSDPSTLHRRSHRGDNWRRNSRPHHRARKHPLLDLSHSTVWLVRKATRSRLNPQLRSATQDLGSLYLILNTLIHQMTNVHHSRKCLPSVNRFTYRRKCCAETEYVGTGSVVSQSLSGKVVPDEAS